MRTLTFCLIFPLLIACAPLKLASPNTVSLKIEQADRKTLSFEGRGAGAGMMLMSSMGSMGIAIGIAIDEGIAKDIAKVQSDDFSIVGISYDLFKKVSQDQGVKVKGHKAKRNITIQIERFGFKTVSGDTDSVNPVVALRILEEGKESFSVKYPNSNFADVPKSSLDAIKTDGKLSQALLEQALVQIFQKYYQ